jgi:superfamily II DNA or RNA helicase
MLTVNYKVASWVSLPSSIETKIQKPRSDGYIRLRKWQKKCFYKLKDESHSIINTPTGCGKSIAIKSIVWKKLRNNPKLKSIIVVPQAFVSKGFLGKKNPDGSSIPNFILLPDGERMEWSPFHDLAVGYDESSINGLIDFLKDRNKNKNINSKILVCCSQTFVLAFEKISKMNSTERNKLIRDLLVVIDEAHHVKIMEETEEDIAIHNALGAQVKNLYHSSNRGNQIILVTATFFRGDRCQLLSQEMKPSFVRFDLPWDKWLPQMQHLKSFTYDYVFDRTIDNYDESMDKSITHLFQQNLKKLVVYIPQRNSFFAQKGKEGKNNEVDRIIKIIAEKLDAVVEGKTKDGIIQLKLADGTHYRILDLVGEELRDAKKKFFSGYSGEDINANRDAIDCIIALNMFGEGADWEHANGMIIVGQKDSLTDLVQRVGRVLRDSEGKPTAKVMHILPFNLNEDPDDSLGDSLNNRFKALALAMLMMDVMNPELVLPKGTREKSNEKNDRVKNQSILSQLPLDENELKSFNEDVTREMLTLASNQQERDGNYSCSLIKEQMPRIVRESIEDVLTEKDIFLTDEKYVQLGNEMYHKVCRHAVAQEYGINVAEIEWNMIENADPISFLLRFISQSVDGDALIRLRDLLSMNEVDSNEICHKVCEFVKDYGFPHSKLKDEEGKRLGNWLEGKIRAYAGKKGCFYESDLDIATSHGFPDLFDQIDREEYALKKLRSIIEKIKLKGKHYPSSASEEKEEVSDYAWINTKRRQKYEKNDLFYESLQKLASDSDLYDLFEMQNKSKDNFYLFLDFWKSNQRMPNSNSENEEETKIACYLQHLIKSKESNQRKKTIDEIEQLANQEGVGFIFERRRSEDCLENNALDMIKQYCEFYKKNNRSPHMKSNDDYERSLGVWFNSRIQVKKGKYRGVHYPVLDEIPKLYGIGFIWNSYEDDSNQMCHKLCQFVKNQKRMPSDKNSEMEEKKIAQWFFNKRKSKSGGRGNFYDSDQKIIESYGFAGIFEKGWKPNF